MLKLQTISLWFLFLLHLQQGDCAEIIGGHEVSPHSLPYMALLQDSKGNPICGGTLIHPQWVLTAAHCKDVQKVVLGVHKRSSPDSYRQIRQVKKSVPHPHYDANSKVNDLMLLKLDRKADKSAAVKELRLPSSILDVPAGVGCTVAGWGATKNRAKVMSDVLRSANVTVIDRKLCNSKTYYDNNPVITHDMLCVGSTGKKRSDSCAGDSGGPLLCQGVFRGVTSFGAGCGIKTKPGVYTALFKKHIEWIKKIIRTSV